MKAFGFRVDDDRAALGPHCREAICAAVGTLAAEARIKYAYPASTAAKGGVLYRIARCDIGLRVLPYICLRKANGCIQTVSRYADGESNGAVRRQTIDDSGSGCPAA